MLDLSIALAVGNGLVPFIQVLFPDRIACRVIIQHIGHIGIPILRGIAFLIKPRNAHGLVLLVVDPADFRHALAIVDGLVVSIQILLTNCVARRIVIPQHRHIGIAVGRGLPIRIEPAFPDYFFILVVYPANVRVALVIIDKLVLFVQILFPRHIPGCIIIPQHCHVGITVSYRNSLAVKPSLADGLIVFIVVPMDLRNPFRVFNGLVRRVEVLLPDRITRLVIFPDHGYIGVSRSNRLTVHAEPAFASHLFLRVIFALDLGIPFAVDDGLVLFIQVLFPDRIARRVVVQFVGHIGIPILRGISFRVKPGYAHSLVFLVVNPANLGYALTIVDGLVVFI